MILRVAGYYDESLQMFHKCLDLYTKLIGENVYDALFSMGQLGATLFECKKFQAAACWLEKALVGYLKLRIVDRDAVYFLLTLTKCYKELGLFGDIRRVSMMMDQHTRGTWLEGICELRGERLLIVRDWMDELGLALVGCRQFQEARYWCGRAETAGL
jgi:tetratricopeptide (TPR) repeat protein